MRPVPAEPFTSWPVQLYDARFGFAWYTEPCALVVQLVHERGTVTAVHALHDAIDHVIQREQRAIQSHGGLLIFHDWRQMHSYDSDARVAFLDRMKVRGGPYLRRVVAVLPDRPLLKMAAQTANIVMALTSGGSMQIATQPTPPLIEHGIMPPAAVGWY